MLEIATHSSIPARKLPWAEEPGGLQSMGSQRVWLTEWWGTHSSKLRERNYQKYTYQTLSHIEVNWKRCTPLINLVLPSSRMMFGHLRMAKGSPHYVGVKVKVTQLCPTPWDSMDCSLSRSSVHGILQARVQEWLPFPSHSPFPTRGSNPGLLHWRRILYQLSHKGRQCLCLWNAC